MALCNVVEKERRTRRADNEGVLLITVDFRYNATLSVYYIQRLKVVDIKNDQFSVIFVHRWCCTGPVCNSLMIDNGYVYVTFRSYMHASFVFFRPVCNLLS